MSDSDNLECDSVQPAKTAKSQYDTLSRHHTQQSSQGSQNIIIETGLDQDQLKTRHTINVIVNNNKKERQKRYREQNRDKLKQREAERRKRIQYSQSIARPSTSSNTNRIELNNKGIITAQSSFGLEKTQPSSIKRNEQGNELNALQKKRARQQRYREQNRDELKQREAERRRRLQNAEMITEEFTQIINSPIIDEISTNSRSVAGLEEMQHLVVEVSQQNGRVSQQWVKELEKNRVHAEKKIAAATHMIAEAVNKIAEASLMNAETNRMNAETNRMNAETNRKQLEVMKAIMDVVGQPSSARLRAVHEDSSQSENKITVFCPKCNTAVPQTLNEKEGPNAGKRQEPPEKRCRNRKRSRQTDSSSEEDSSGDNDDNEQSSNCHDEEPEIDVGPTTVKVEPIDIEVNKEQAHTDPISLDVKTKPRDDEVDERSMFGETEIKLEQIEIHEDGFS